MTKRKTKKQGFPQQRQHEEIDQSIRLNVTNGRCAAGCGKPSKNGVTCGDLECVRKWLRIGELCPNCRKHFFHKSTNGFCSIQCENEHSHRIDRLKDLK